MRSRPCSREIPDEATIVVGGDVVAVGAQPAETLERLRALGDRVRVAPRQHRPGADAGRGRGSRRRRWSRRRGAGLSEEQIAFLHELPPTVQIGRVLYCHASPRNDMDIFTEETPEERIAFLFEDVDADVVVCGHSHTQFERVVAGRRVVNAGSVGIAVRGRSRAPTGCSTSSTGARPTKGRRSSDRATRLSRGSPSLGSDLVPIGRVGKPHGLDGSFFVEGPSEREEAFANGATLYVDGEAGEDRRRAARLPAAAP